MEKHVYPNVPVTASRLGFGAMRLPVLSDGKTVNEAEAIAMIRHAIDSGVTYIDTAYPYHGGQSELVVGKALLNGYRDKVTLATKLPLWALKTEDDMERILNEQLEKLQTDHIDFYLLHAMSRDRLGLVRSLHYQQFMDRAVADGRIRFPSFSFHDDHDTFTEILNDYDFKMCQLQMNYLDIHNQATLEGVREAGKKGMSVVIMEPLLGGSLANPPQEVRALFEGAAEKRSAVEWAFRFLRSLPEVCTILSGMSTMAQVDDNLAIFNKPADMPLTQAEDEVIAKARAAYLARIKTGCTGCAYCQPCPRGVTIPNVFRGYDSALMLDRMERYMDEYKNMREEKHTVSECVNCKKCESACPQHLPITKYLREIDEAIQ